MTAEAELEMQNAECRIGNAECRMQPARIGMLLVLALASGCALFSRSKSQFYTLERIPPATSIAATGGLPVAINSVELPPGFDRREIVVRQAGRRLEVRGTQQWSASLQPMVLHTLAFDLAARMPEGMVILPGVAKPVGAMRSIDVIVEEIAAGPEARVVLDARWLTREAGLPDITRHEAITIDLASLESGQIATGHSRAIAALADRMAAQLVPGPAGRP